MSVNCPYEDLPKSTGKFPGDVETKPVRPFAGASLIGSPASHHPGKRRVERAFTELLFIVTMRRPHAAAKAGQMAPLESTPRAVVSRLPIRAA